MVFHALSKNQQAIKKRRAENAKLQKAVDAYRQEQTKPDSEPRKGIRYFAKRFGVSKSTLGRAIEGKLTRSAFSESRQKLTPVQERVLVDFITESADRGFPLVHRQIEEYANELLIRAQGPDAEPVGKSWIFAFLDRHRDDLQTHWSKPLDTQRAKSLNPKAVEHWFDLVEKVIEKEGVRPEDIYGMDESGFPPSNQGTQRVVGRRGTKTQHKQGGANKENVTAVVTICADGTTVTPLIIYKGKKAQKRWFDNNVAGAQYVLSDPVVPRSD